jgi:CelD/BcsL family acetyltransferase involved in cellulose biosynthesis
LGKWNTSSKPPLRNSDESISLYRIDPLRDGRWASFLATHPRACVFHTPSWLEAIRRTYGYQPVVHTTSAAGIPLKNGLVLCEIESWLTGRRLVSLPFSDHCDPLIGQAELSSFFTAIQNQTLRDNWRYLELRPLHAIEQDTSRFQSVTEYFCHRLDLGPSIEALLQSLHRSSIQRKIRRAEREGIVCRKSSGESLLKHFYAMFSAARRRHKIPPQPFPWFRNLLDCFGEAAQIQVAYKKDQPIASILTLQYKDTLTYKYGCSDVRFNTLGGTQLLFWRAIEEAKQVGLSTFDLGRSEVGNAGLILFKDRWGAQRSRLTYVRFPFRSLDHHGSLTTISGWRGGFAKQVFSHAPSKVISLISNMLYKHVG